MSRVHQCSECQEYYQLPEKAIEYINNTLFVLKSPSAKFKCECACGIKVGFESQLPTIYMLGGFDCEHENNNDLKTFKAVMLVKCDKDDPEQCSLTWDVVKDPSEIYSDHNVIYLKPKPKDVVKIDTIKDMLSFEDLQIDFNTLIGIVGKMENKEIPSDDVTMWLDSLDIRIHSIKALTSLLVVYKNQVSESYNKII